MSIEITFTKMADTKNKVRFLEDDSEIVGEIVGSLYVSKEAVAKELGGAERLRVTIEAVTKKKKKS